MTVEEEFLAAYEAARVESQRTWYESRIAEYESADREAAWLRHGSLGAAAACGALGALGVAGSAWWGVAAAVFGALAAMITAWSDVIGFKLNAALFRHAAAGLDGLRSDRPAPPLTKAQNIGYVRGVESVLTGEVEGWTEQWGEAVKPTKGE